MSFVANPDATNDAAANPDVPLSFATSKLYAITAVVRQHRGSLRFAPGADSVSQSYRRPSTGLMREAHQAGHTVAIRQITMDMAPTRANSRGTIRTGRWSIM